jgi:hypothetical protein
MSRIIGRTTRSLALLSLAMGVLLTGQASYAQNLGLEGETGVFITPLAYTADSPAHGIGEPVVAYHFLAAGNVIGTFSNISVNEGAFGRLEFGYSRDVHTTADNPKLSPLWHDGFNILQGKVNIVKENTGKHNWIPAIAIGGVVRTQVHNIGGAIANRDTNNGDAYAVATKTIVIKQLHGLPIILNGGVRGTNGVLWGFGGNATRFQGRVFGAVAFGMKGPGSIVFLLASEVAQQPPHLQNLPGAVIPTTITYDVRILPSEKSRINLDLGVAQIANRILPGVDLNARHQFGMGISLRF